MAPKLKVTASVDKRSLRALSKALKRGYLAMAVEDRATAERGLRVTREVLR